MCISRCHIIFWGDKTITNLGITSWNVILWNVNVRAIKWRDMIYFALVATLWRATSEYCNDVYHYEECWIAAVSCMCIRNFQLFRWWIVNIYRSFFVMEERVDGTFWSWIMNSRDVIPVQRQTDEQYTSVNFLLLDEHLHQDIYIVDEVRCYCFIYYWWNIFRHPSIIFFVYNLVNGHSSSLHSFVEDFHIQTTTETLNRDWQHFESTPRNCVTLWTMIVN